MGKEYYQSSPRDRWLELRRCQISSEFSHMNTSNRFSDVSKSSPLKDSYSG